MSITVLSYHDQALVDRVNAQALARAEAAKAAAEAAAASTEDSFSSVLDEATKPYLELDTTVTPNECPDWLLPVFEQAASTYELPIELLTSIARAESNYNAYAVSSAGAMGIMQLMPATAAALGVSDPYNATENIMGGAKYIYQLLAKYDGDTTLALAAYNAGSSNVAEYGGVPPFAETQNYIKKVLSYMNATVNAATNTASSTVNNAVDTLTEFLTENNISKDALDLFVTLLKLSQNNDTSTVSG